MNKPSTLHTAEMLAHLPADGHRYELVQGELRMMSPAGGRHGRVTQQFARLLGNHVVERQLGVVYAAETGFMIETNPDTVRAPDVAFVDAAQLSQLDDDTGYLPFPPSLAIETISPHDRFTEVEEKAFKWLEAGTRAVVVIDPINCRVYLYRAPRDIRVYDTDADLDLGEVVPDFRVAVNDLFQ